MRSTPYLGTPLGTPYYSCSSSTAVAYFEVPSGFLVFFGEEENSPKFSIRYYPGVPRGVPGT